MRGEFNRQAIATLEKILQIVLLFASIFLAEKSSILDPVSAIFKSLPVKAKTQSQPKWNRIDGQRYSLYRFCTQWRR
ncbi:hypothetical protein FG081_03765 [Vibrio cholerae]|nr:hypothetical protein [Vibrio cholerae]EGR0159750.1 hypothetical protein [Vibrio cholerae]EGR0310436.1 hypothetical protein [Vibrio cholerae]EGR0519159.1 hypothetical protein [Vibrio cholerae]EGR0595102.1 hypothetical protein [Vibrio cholerae]